jgi:hypothetical protein
MIVMINAVVTEVSKIPKSPNPKIKIITNLNNHNDLRSILRETSRPGVFTVQKA